MEYGTSVLWYIVCTYVRAHPAHSGGEALVAQRAPRGRELRVLEQRAARARPRPTHGALRAAPVSAQVTHSMTKDNKRSLDGYQSQAEDD